MIVAALVISLLINLALGCHLWDVTRENTGFREQIEDWRQRDFLNRATAQEIHDDLRICKIERNQNEALLARKVARTSIWL